MSEKQTHESDRPVDREFAFSRVAGASPTEYAAVSTTAVAALVVSFLGLLGLLWVWGLVASAVSLLLALLSIYYIATSAGTLTGRKIAASAIAVSLVFGGSGVIRHVVAYRQRQADAALVRAMARRACEHVLAGDYEAFYRQLGSDYRDGVPLGYWRYEWHRFFDVHGPVRRVSLADRTWFFPSGRILLTMKIHVGDPEREDESGRPAERVVSVRLLYGRRDRHETSGGGEPTPRVEDDSLDRWELADLPSFIRPLPPRFIEPLVWPAPGPTQAAWLDESRGIKAQLSLPPLVPPTMLLEAWVPRPPPPVVHGHHHHH